MHHLVVVTISGGPSGTAAGDPLADVLDRYAGRALALARRIVVDESLAEDVVQEALLAYWRKPSAYDPARGAFGPWLLALVHHKAVDAVRRETAQRRLAAAAGKLALVQPATTPDTADLAVARATAGSVRTAVTALPPRAARRDPARLLGRPHPARDRPAHRRAPGHGQDADALGHAAAARRAGHRRPRTSADARRHLTVTAPGLDGRNSPTAPGDP